MSDNTCLVCGEIIPEGRQVCIKCTMSPCPPQCPNRTESCKFDGTCDRYAKWNGWHQERLAEKHRQQAAEADIYEARRCLIKKAKGK